MKIRFLICVLWVTAALAAVAQPPSTTTVQGTIYSAAGAPISGTLQLSWPSFTTAANQAIAAGRLTVAIGSDGFFSVNLAPNMGAMPAGLYYTAVYHLADGTTSTEYWTVPAAPQATLSAVRAQVMPAAQAIQAVNKAYVDQAIQQYATNQVSTFGGTLTGPLYLNGDPVVPTQATDKHYVDALFAQSLPSTGGAASGPLTATQLGAVYQADQAPGGDFTAKLQACVNGLNSTYGGTCDARNFTGSVAMSGPLTIATANATIQLPCATIATAYPIVIAPGTRNVTLHGCATRGTSSASGSQGGTVFLFSGSAALFEIGDATYAADTLGFHLDNVTINTTAASAATAQAIAAWRTQEMQLTSLYLLGNSNQTALTLDGTGNYTGGTFSDIEIGGFLSAVNAIGHQVSNPATTDWLNASTFLRLHIDCPTSGGSPIAGSIGINLQAGDGNTFTGGDVEGCGTALHLGASAQNNTIVGLRNENSINQIVADAGSSYNNWITGGTMFTGKLTDNGTRNSFLDTFHRSFNALNGDWYGSQQDATLTNHFRLGIGSGTERGLLKRYQTDYGYRWTTGLSDASAGEQFYQVLDELNNVYRLSIGQYNHGQSSSNNQTVLNSAGTGAIVLNGSNNAGTGGVTFGSGGATSSTVATVDKSGNAQFNGTLQVGGTSQSTGTMTVRNNADAEVDYYLWPGLSTSQKGSFTYKDYNGNSQWYLVKDSSNNWALNSAVGGLDSFKAYQSTNSGDTYVNASNTSGAVRVNYETGSGSAFNIYGGNSSTLYAGFTGPNAIKFPGLAASSGHSCMQIDSTGYISNTGAQCGGGGTVNSGILGQIAYYTATGAILAGLTAVPVTNGGTGATTPAAAVANIGAVPASGGAMTGPLTGTSASFSGGVAAESITVGQSNTVLHPEVCASANYPSWCGSQAGPGVTPDYGYWISKAYQSAACPKTGCAIELPSGVLQVKSPIDLASQNKQVTLRGQGSGILGQWGTTLDYQGPAASTAITLTSYYGATLKDFTLLNDAKPGASILLDIDGAGVNNSNHIVLDNVTFGVGSNGAKVSTAVIRLGACTHAGCTGGAVPVDIDMYKVYSFDAGSIGFQALWGSLVNLYGTRFVGDTIADIQVGSATNVVYNFQMYGGSAEQDSTSNSNPILILGALTMGIHGTHIECDGTNPTTSGIYAPATAYSIQNLTIDDATIQCNASGNAAPFDVYLAGGNTGQNIVNLQGNTFSGAATAAVHVSNTFLLRESNNTTAPGLPLNDADVYAVVSSENNLENTTLLPPQELIPSGGQKTWRLYGSGTNLASLNSSGDFWVHRNLLIGGTGSYPTTEASNNTAPRTATWPDSSGTVAWTSQLTSPVTVTVNSGQTTGSATVSSGTTGCTFSATNAAAMLDMKANGGYGSVSGTTFTLTLGANATGTDTFYALCK